MAIDIAQMLMDTFHGRWAKMLSARARAEQSMSDVLQLIEATKRCIGLAAEFGIRPLPKLGNVLQVTDLWRDCLHYQPRHCGVLLSIHIRKDVRL